MNYSTDSLQNTTDKSIESSISVITYNVQFLPFIAEFFNERSHARYRARRIAHEISDFDIIALQEVFHNRRRRTILKTIESIWGSPPYYTKSPQNNKRITCGGTMILSKYPIIQSDSITFQYYSKFRNHGFKADGLAAKGVIHGRIEIIKSSKIYIDVFVTHLDALNPAIRKKQIIELTEFIKTIYCKNIPILIMGDFNIDGTSNDYFLKNNEYLMLKKLLNDINSNLKVIDIWIDLNDNKPGNTTNQHCVTIGQRIDYIFMFDYYRNMLSPKTASIHPFLDTRVFALSDHNAVSATFEIK